jgi:hypothetical protein
MRKILPLTLIALTTSFYAAASSPAVPNIGIGGGETNSRTHLRFDGVPKDARIVKVSAHLIVDKVAPTGLNFFAVQVNYPNKTWAHGGPQFTGGTEKANWGGLVNRGGGSTDYRETDWSKDLLLIEYGVEKANTVPFKWERGCEYVLTVERGKQVHLPAGTNAHFHVTVPERTMWEWRFTITPVEKGHESFSSLLYDSADHLSSFYLWNESGYGSTSQEQHTRWSIPTYRTEDSTEEKVPTGWRRF